MRAAPEFFGPLGEKLSQGDIVSSIPWGLIDAPLTVCRPSDRSKPEGKATYAPVGTVKPPFKDIETVFAKAQLGLGMVLWHDCQIDKFENQQKPPEKWFAAVAPLVPLQEHDQDASTAVREGRRRAFFFVPEYPAIGIPKPMYVDLRHIWPLKQSLLGNRIGTLSMQARGNLYAHLFSFLTQRSLGNEVKCVKCGEMTPVIDALPAVPDE
jgi:hypothetical protein